MQVVFKVKTLRRLQNLKNYPTFCWKYIVKFRFRRSQNLKKISHLFWNYLVMSKQIFVAFSEYLNFFAQDRKLPQILSGCCLHKFWVIYRRYLSYKVEWRCPVDTIISVIVILSNRLNTKHLSLIGRKWQYFANVIFHFVFQKIFSGIYKLGGELSSYYIL